MTRRGICTLEWVDGGGGGYVSGGHIRIRVFLYQGLCFHINNIVIDQWQPMSVVVVGQ